MNLFVRIFSRLDTRLQLVVIAAIVGIIGGLASILLNFGLHTAAHYLHPMREHWYAAFLPALGILTAVFLFHKVFRDKGEHGVPEVIYSISKRGGILRLRTAFSRLITCLVTLAGGGSAGPEAPVVMSGASIGSNIASQFRLKDRQRIVVVGCGASAAIAAIFNAPATGIMFTMEAVIGEWTQVNLIPIAIASVVGTEVSRILQGNQIPFAHHSITVHYADLIACVGLSLLAAASAIFFVRVLRNISHLMEHHLKSIWIRAVVGGLAVGVIGIFLPQVLGEGYGNVRAILGNTFRPHLAMIGAIIFAKMVATALTTGAGGIGGVFAPCLVLGALTGLFYRQAIGMLLPDVMFSEQGYYGLIGMAAMVSGVLKAPLTAIFLIVEITGGYDVLASVMLVSVLSASLSSFLEPDSLYHRELLKKGLLLRSRTDARVLSEMRVIELIENDFKKVVPDMRLGEFVNLVTDSKRNYFPVETPSGEFLGLVTLDNVRAFLFDQHMYDSVLVEEFMDDDIPVIHPDDPLTDIVAIMDRTHLYSLPVVENGRFIGMISKGNLLDHYRKEMVAQEET